MPLEDALFARAKAHAGLTALIGAADATRFYPVQAAPKAATPYVVHEIDDDQEQGHAMGVDVAPRRAFCRFWCYGATGDSARSTATQLIACFRRYSGVHGAVTINDCYLRGNRAGVDDDVKLQFRLVEIEIVYQE